MIKKIRSLVYHKTDGKITLTDKIVTEIIELIQQELHENICVIKLHRFNSNRNGYEFIRAFEATEEKALNFIEANITKPQVKGFYKYEVFSLKGNTINVFHSINIDLI